MTTKEAASGQVNAPRKDSYSDYLDRLFALLERDPGKLFLLSAILHFRWEHETPRTFWERYWNEDKRTPDDLRTDYDIDYNYWDRVWNMRGKARRVIQGLEPWPPEFLPWKGMQELLYYHGRRRKRPVWLDANASRVSIKSSLADARRERRAHTRKARR